MFRKAKLIPQLLLISHWPEFCHVSIFAWKAARKNWIENGNWVSQPAVWLIKKNFFNGIPGGSDGKASACNAGDPGSIPGLWEDPLEKEMATNSSTLAWKIPGMEELVGYSPRGHKESDTTEWLHFFSLQLVYSVVLVSWV